MCRVARLEQISTEMTNAFIRNRVVQDGIAPKTANRIRETLHRMFSYAIEHNGYVCPDRGYRNAEAEAPRLQLVR